MKKHFKHCFDIKVKMWRPFVIMALWGLVLTACSDSTDNPDYPGEEVTTGDDASDKMPFLVKQATGKDDEGSVVKYSDFSAFYAPSVGEQIVNWYNK